MADNKFLGERKFEENDKKTASLHITKNGIIPERKFSSITIGSMLKTYFTNECNEKALDIYPNANSKLLGDKAKYEGIRNINQTQIRLEIEW